MPMMIDHGFWRRIHITPASRSVVQNSVAENAVIAELEDDFHCMSVVLHHNQGRVLNIEADMHRAPWSTCPGATTQLLQTFSGAKLSEFPRQGQKKINCTHLYDLAVLGAAHALDENPTIYDIRVSDPIDHTRQAAIYSNRRLLLHWIEKNFHLTEPAAAAGIRLDQLRSWIDTLAPELQEPARLLQWGNILANGRVIPLAEQSDATRMPPSCHTFQPERAKLARRVGGIQDFSKETSPPLTQYSAVKEVRIR
ncbi:MAG: hypothetical protein CMK79_09060 [Pseudomonadales bacterium]|nr:hypothetical protein [Pseudomonadales bacterium]